MYLKKQVISFSMLQAVHGLRSHLGDFSRFNTSSILTAHDLFGLVSSIHSSFDLDLTVNVPILSLLHL